MNHVYTGTSGHTGAMNLKATETQTAHGAVTGGLTKMFTIDEESLLLLILIDMYEWKKAHADSPRIDLNVSGEEITADDVKIENRADMESYEQIQSDDSRA